MWTDKAREIYKDDGPRYPSDLTDAEWQTIGPVVCQDATLTADLREMVNACPYLEKAGYPWRYLPKEFGPWQTVRTRRKPAVSPGTTASGPTGSGPMSPRCSRGRCARGRAVTRSRRRHSWTRRASRRGRKRVRAASTATKR